MGAQLQDFLVVLMHINIREALLQANQATHLCQSSRFTALPLYRIPGMPFLSFDKILPVLQGSVGDAAFSMMSFLILNFMALFGFPSWH